MHSVRALGAALLLLLAAAPSFAQDNADCMRCHEDEELYVEKGGEELPGWIVMETFERSVHGRLECVACHVDLMDAELPHEDELEPVDCGECHEAFAKKHANSIHGQALAGGDPMAPRCQTCHGKHDILGHTDPASRTFAMNIPRLCGSCHKEGSPVTMTHDIPQDRIFENYSQSIHGEGVFKKGLIVTAVCTSCHTSHDILPHTDPRASVSPQNVVAMCQTCHANIENVHRKVIDGQLWEKEPHKIPNCVDCHSPHKVRRPFYDEGMANKDCLVCHGQSSLRGMAQGKETSLHVDEHLFDGSAHEGVGCAQCHVEAQKSRERACETIVNKVDCAICHAEVVDAYAGSSHAVAVKNGGADGPDCVRCHTKHNVLKKDNRASPSFPRNSPDLCAECHRIELSDGTDAPNDPILSYEHSVHGIGLRKSGLLVTATCVDCHGPHAVLPGWEPKSLVYGDNIAATCGTCHDGIEELYETSVHFRGRKGVSRLLPSCKECHASHQITLTNEAGFRDQVRRQCGYCHQEQYESYFETFHGKVSRLGFDRAATCSDCHGQHDVQHIFDPRSTVAEGNLVATCAKCHEGAHEGFAKYLPHGTHTDPDKYPLLFWSYWGMTGLLLGTMAFFGLHSLLWMLRLWTSRKEWAPIKAVARAEGAVLYRRFSRIQRGLHFAMVLSFFTLAFTGMSLKFSYTGWAKAVANVLGGFEVTGVLHRLAAIMLITVFVTHVWDVNVRRKEAGDTWWQLLCGQNSILFQPKDITEFIGTIKWFLGMGPRPRYSRWAYWEKFDYFAVFWGVAIIGSTGLLLWFPVQLTKILPGWVVNVATIVHGDEALLAVAFIFTIHFFNTQFRPDKFPLDPVVFSGRMSLEELRHERPLEYEALEKSGKLEEHIAPALIKPFQRAIRVFATMALLFGSMLVVLIVMALLFISPT